MGRTNVMVFLSLLNRLCLRNADFPSGLSKLAVTLYTRELHARLHDSGSGIVVAGANPGPVRTGK